MPILVLELQLLSESLVFGFDLGNVLTQFLDFTLIPVPDLSCSHIQVFLILLLFFSKQPLKFVLQVLQLGLVLPLNASSIFLLPLAIQIPLILLSRHDLVKLVTVVLCHHFILSLL